jgi:hypothetical protein
MVNKVLPRQEFGIAGAKKLPLDVSDAEAEIFGNVPGRWQQ